LPQRLPVFQGGQEHSAEAVVLGVLGSDHDVLACGTGWWINSVTQHGKVVQIHPQLDLNVHIIPDLWIPSLFLGAVSTYHAEAVSHVMGNQTH